MLNEGTILCEINNSGPIQKYQYVFFPVSNDKTF